jgi:hypothetical protein
MPESGRRKAKRVAKLKMLRGELKFKRFWPFYSAYGKRNGIGAMQINVWKSRKQKGNPSGLEAIYGCT